MYCDNKSAEVLASNRKYYTPTKHIELDLYFFLDHVAKHKLSIAHVSNPDKLANILIKPLAYDEFAYLGKRLNVLLRPQFEG